MLAKTTIHLRSETDDDDLIFSPIADLGHFNEKSRQQLRRDIGNATLYIRFNSLISQAVLSRSWRQINYERVIGADIYLVRWLTKLLGLRFTYAAPNKSYNIKLSTIIEGSGVSLCARLSDNLKQVEQALLAMTDVIARYAIEKEFTVHQPTGRGRVLADAKIIIRPTSAFTVEQMKTNMHENDLDEAVITEAGTIMLEPKQTKFSGFIDYQDAKATYAGGRKIKKA